MTTSDEREMQLVIRAAGLMVFDAVLRALEADGHSWSARPCETCHFVSSVVGRPFGCSAEAIRRAKG